MFFKTQAFTAPKDFGFEKENMDAYGFDPERGIVAVADGAASGLFSGPWADIISTATVAETPNLYDSENFAAWLAERRREWCERVDLKNLNFFQRGKLQQWGGGSTTLVWGEFYPLNGEAAEATDDVTTESDSSETDVMDSLEPETATLETAESETAETETPELQSDELETADDEVGDQVAEAVEHNISDQEVAVEQPVEPEQDASAADENIEQDAGESTPTAQATEEANVEANVVATDAPGYLFRGYAIGDSCLFHIRDGKLLKAFPLEVPDEFSADPNVIGSVDRKTDHMMEFQSYEARCQIDDQLIFCTDALAWWVLKQFERGTIDWELFWSMDEDAWIDFVASIRQDEEGMRLDDTTIVLLKLLNPAPLADEEAQTSSDPQALDEAAVGTATVAETETVTEEVDVEDVVFAEVADGTNEPTIETADFETLPEGEPVETMAEDGSASIVAVEVGYDESHDVSSVTTSEDAHEEATDPSEGSEEGECGAEAESVEASPEESVATIPDPTDAQAEPLELEDASCVTPVEDENLSADDAEASIQESQPE